MKELILNEGKRDISPLMPTTLLVLPLEMVYEISKGLSLPDLVALASTSKTMARRVRCLWQRERDVGYLTYRVNARIDPGSLSDMMCNLVVATKLFTGASMSTIPDVPPPVADVVDAALGSSDATPCTTTALVGALTQYCAKTFIEAHWSASDAEKRNSWVPDLKFLLDGSALTIHEFGHLLASILLVAEETLPMEADDAVAVFMRVTSGSRLKDVADCLLCLLVYDRTLFSGPAFCPHDHMPIPPASTTSDVLDFGRIMAILSYYWPLENTAFVLRMVGQHFGSVDEALVHRMSRYLDSNQIASILSS